MNFNSHFDLAGKHAFLSASKYHWTNYSDEKLANTYRTALAAQRGTDLHDFAMNAIRLGINMPRNKKTINHYINDAIGFRMTPEQVLYYSDNAFGTADTISFKQARGSDRPLLRIHDLKTGVIPGNMRQLYIYTAFFCLEYGYKPTEIDVELRIYQNDECLADIPDPDDIAHIMDRVITFSAYIDQIRMEALS